MKDDERAYALGVQAICFRLLGTIPSPILYGLALDRGCVLWKSDSEYDSSCLLYDNFSISRRVYHFVLETGGIS